MKGSQEMALLIKEISKSKKITVGQMLADCELSVNTLSTMQSKNYYPRLESLVKIADYLDVSIDYLLGREYASSGSGNNYSYISNIGENAMIGENNRCSSDDISEDAIEMDKVLRSLNHKDKINVISAFYYIVDKLKKRVNATSYKYKLKTEFLCNWK